MVWVLDSRIAHMLLLDREIVGVIACLPDVNPLLRATGSRLRLSTPLHYLGFRRGRTRASLVFGAVAPEMQNRGAAALLLHAALVGMRRAGYGSSASRGSRTPTRRACARCRRSAQSRCTA